MQLSDDTGKADELRRDWRTLLGATLGVAISTPGLNFYTLGVMMPFLVEFAGRTREEISVVQFVFSAIVAVFAPVAGALMDRFGVLRVAAISLLIESAGFAMLGASAHILPLFALSMMLLALFGLGTTPLGYGRIVSATFDKRRGIALGLMVSGVGTMAVLSPIVLNTIIEQSDWRTGYYALAAIVLVIGGSGILILRGTENHPARQQSAQMSAGGNWLDLRKPLFWFLVLGFCLPAILGGGYVIHLISALREKGMAMGDAVQVQSVIGASILASRLISGAALDRFSVGAVTATIFAISGVGCLMLSMDSYAMVLGGAFALGLTVGAELDIIAYVISRKFSMQNFTRLYGLSYGLLVITGGVSPLLVTIFHSSFGDYTIPLVIGAAGHFIGAAIIYLAVRSLAPESKTAPVEADAPSLRKEPA